MKYIQKETQLSDYMFHPKFLFKMKISETAKNVYVLLLNRARLSQKNYDKWHDDSNGRVYLNFTIQSLAYEMDKSPSTIKCCLKQLRESGLIETVQVGACEPSKIYVKLPEFNMQNSVKSSDCNAKNHNASSSLGDYDYDEDTHMLEDENLPF